MLNKRISSQIIVITFGILTALFSAAFYSLAWMEPSQPPPEVRVPPPINAGPVYQQKAGALAINTVGADTGLIVVGRVGIGTLDPQEELQVEGDIKAVSFINVPKVILPSCGENNRGQQYLLMRLYESEDGFYICGKKTDGSFGWHLLSGTEVEIRPVKSIWDIQGMAVSGSNNVWQVLKTINVPADAKQIACTLEYFGSDQGSAHIYYYNDDEYEFVISGSYMNIVWSGFWGIESYELGSIAQGGKLELSAWARGSGIIKSTCNYN